MVTARKRVSAVPPCRVATSTSTTPVAPSSPQGEWVSPAPRSRGQRGLQSLLPQLGTSLNRCPTPICTLPAKGRGQGDKGTRGQGSW